MLDFIERKFKPTPKITPRKTSNGIEQRLISKNSPRSSYTKVIPLQALFHFSITHPRYTKRERSLTLTTYHQQQRAHHRHSHLDGSRIRRRKPNVFLDRTQLAAFRGEKCTRVFVPRQRTRGNFMIASDLACTQVNTRLGLIVIAWGPSPVIASFKRTNKTKKEDPGMSDFSKAFDPSGATFFASFAIAVFVSTCPEEVRGDFALTRPASAAICPIRCQTRGEVRKLLQSDGWGWRLDTFTRHTSRVCRNVRVITPSRRPVLDPSFLSAFRTSASRDRRLRLCSAGDTVTAFHYGVNDVIVRVFSWFDAGGLELCILN